MHEVIGSNPIVIHSFAIRFVQVHTSTYKYIPVYISMRRFVLVCTCLYLFVLVCTCLHMDKLIQTQYVTLHTNTDFHILVHTRMKQVHTSIYQYILVCTCMTYYILFHTMLLFMAVCKFCAVSIRGTSRYIQELIPKSCHKRFHRVSSMVSAF